MPSSTIIRMNSEKEDSDGKLTFLVQNKQARLEMQQ